MTKKVKLTKASDERQATRATREREVYQRKEAKRGSNPQLTDIASNILTTGKKKAKAKSDPFGARLRERVFSASESVLPYLFRQARRTRPPRSCERKTKSLEIHATRGHRVAYTVVIALF